MESIQELHELNEILSLIRRLFPAVTSARVSDLGNFPAVVVGDWVSLRIEERDVRSIMGLRPAKHYVIEEMVTVRGGRWSPDETDYVEVSAHRSRDEAIEALLATLYRNEVAAALRANAEAEFAALIRGSEEE